jgi:Tfp pilus assembly PilM family ATPase
MWKSRAAVYALGIHLTEKYMTGVFIRRIRHRITIEGYFQKDYSEATLKTLEPYLRSRRIVVSIPNTYAIHYYTYIPSIIAPQEYPDWVAIEMQSYLDCSAQDYLLHFKCLSSETQEDTGQKIYIIGVRRDHIHHHIQHFKTTHIPMHKLELEPYALASLQLKHSLQDHTIAYIEILGDTLSIHIMQDGLCVYFETLPHLDTAPVQINIAIQNYHKSYAKSPIERMYVYGQKYTTHMATQIQQALHIPTQALSYPADITIAPQCSISQWLAHFPFCAIATGLGLQEVVGA